MRDLGLLSTHEGRTRRDRGNLPSARSRATRNGGSDRPASTSCEPPFLSRSISAGRRTLPGRTTGRHSFEAASSNAGDQGKRTNWIRQLPETGRPRTRRERSIRDVSGSHGCPAARYLTACSPWRATAEQADVPRPPHRLIPRAGPELLVDGKRFRLDSAAREEHLLGDLRERQVVASMGSRRSSAPLSADSPRAVQPRSSWSRDWNSPAWTARIPRPGRRQISSSASRMSASAPARSASPMQTRMSSIPTWTAR